MQMQNKFQLPCNINTTQWRGNKQTLFKNLNQRERPIITQWSHGKDSKVKQRKTQPPTLIVMSKDGK